MRQRKTAKVTFEGGFHNCAPITLRVPLQSIRPGGRTVYGTPYGPSLDDAWYPTPAQERRLEAHFCGIAGCQCGGWRRADVTIGDVD
jgi:hypothetical protein